VDDERIECLSALGHDQQPDRLAARAERFLDGTTPGDQLLVVVELQLVRDGRGTALLTRASVGAERSTRPSILPRTLRPVAAIVAPGTELARAIVPWPEVGWPIVAWPELARAVVSRPELARAVVAATLVVASRSIELGSVVRRPLRARAIVSRPVVSRPVEPWPVKALLPIDASFALVALRAFLPRPILTRAARSTTGGATVGGTATERTATERPAARRAPTGPRPERPATGRSASRTFAIAFAPGPVLP
jgi:hypothetical protein